MIYRVCLRHDDFTIGGRLDCPRSLPWKRNALASSANQEHITTSSLCRITKYSLIIRIAQLPQRNRVWAMGWGGVWGGVFGYSEGTPPQPKYLWGEVMVYPTHNEAPSGLSMHWGCVSRSILQSYRKPL